MPHAFQHGLQGVVLKNSSVVAVEGEGDDGDAHNYLFLFKSLLIASFCRLFNNLEITLTIRVLTLCLNEGRVYLSILTLNGSSANS